MSDEQAKWPSPHGHAIASSETDKMPISNMSRDVVLVRTPDSDANYLAEAVKALRYIATGQCVKDGIYSRDVAQDFLAKIGEQNEH